MRTPLRLGGLGLLLLLASVAQAATISIVADEWCPYNCTPGSDQPGYMIEIAQKVLGEAGHAIDYRTMPWSRAIEEARRGKFDAIVGAAQGDAPDFVFPSVKLGVSSNVLMVKTGSPWRYTDMGSLATVSLGTIRDYSYGDELDAYIGEHEKDPKRVQIASGDNALETNFKKLDAGRIDVLVEDRNVVEYHLAGSGQAAGFSAAGDLGEDDLYIAFSPATPGAAEYAKLIAEGVRRLRASGELAAILARYGLKDWQ
jgi:polar amino acid transport system substrate-binding protein